MVTSESPTAKPVKRKRSGKLREELKRAAIQIEHGENAIIDVTEAVRGDGSPEGAGPSLSSLSRPIVGLDKLAHRIPQALKSLNSIFKHAKLIETRRIIKKVKILRTKPETVNEVKDLEVQLQLLLHLQLLPIIQSHILVKLRKHPSLKHTPLPDGITHLLSSSSSSIPISSSSVTPELVSRVENRLCSSKSVAEGVKATVAWLVYEQGAKLVNRAATKIHKLDGIGSNAVRDNSQGAAWGLRESSESMKQGRHAEAPNSMNGDAAAEIDIADEKDIEASDSEEDRAAEEAGWESGSVQDTPSAEYERTMPQPKRTKSVPTTNRDSGCAVIPTASKRPITSSTFLPTLSTGFTLGDSDSDPDLDRDPDGIVGKHVAERKNRRGQRARQAIWEKKYGKNAVHVIKAREEERNGPVGKGWNASRGGPESLRPKSDSGHEWRKEQGPASRDFPARIAEPAPKQIPKADTSKSLHPSWEAARLRKAKQVVVAPKATKIVFD